MSSSAPRRFADLSPVPWANGGGVTTTIAAGSAPDFVRGAVFAPDPAAAFSADWRLSIAEIDGPSTFSHLPGFDRILVVLAAEPVELVIDGEPVTAEPHVPVHFPGEAVVASLSAGHSRDLNLFLRRGVVTGSVRVGDDVAGSEDGPVLTVDVATGDHGWLPEPVDADASVAVISIRAA